jgi:N-acetylglucosaminyl-diphospho-decaprenol L-rhamnosyltransferase
VSRVETVVVAYNTRDLLAACLDGIERSGPGGEVTVVDSASSDGTADMVRERFSGVRLLALEENRGFAAAVNRGIAQGAAPLVLLLNADTEFLGDPVSPLVSALDAHPGWAAAAPRLVYPDGREQESREPFPGVGATLAGFFRRGRRRSAARSPRDLEIPPVAARRPAWYPMGAALLLRRAALEAVGPLDESYFFYLEEVDWFRRAARAGWGWGLVPEARVVHHLGASLKGADPVLEARVKRNWYRSRLRYFDRHENALRCMALRMGSIPFLGLNAVRHRLRAWTSGDPVQRERARVAGDILGDYLRKRIEPC